MAGRFAFDVVVGRLVQFLVTTNISSSRAWSPSLQAASNWVTLCAEVVLGHQFIRVRPSVKRLGLYPFGTFHVFLCTRFTRVRGF
jgi:hypothetical protein